MDSRTMLRYSVDEDNEQSTAAFETSSSLMCQTGEQCCWHTDRLLSSEETYDPKEDVT